MAITVSCKRSVRAGLALMLVAAMAALALEPSAADSAASPHPGRQAGHAGEYRNPVLNRDFPDPTVIRAANGAYYAYATETDRGGRHIDIQVAKSRDLVHWRSLGDALRRLPR